MILSRSSEITVELDAFEPAELLKAETPPGIWLRVETADGPGGGCPVVSVRGPEAAVRDYVENHWGESLELLSVVRSDAA